MLAALLSASDSSAFVCVHVFVCSQVFVRTVMLWIPIYRQIPWVLAILCGCFIAFSGQLADLAVCIN